MKSSLGHDRSQTCSAIIMTIRKPGLSTRGELPYEEYTGVCHELGSYFQEKIPKRVCQFFTKIPERLNVCEKLQIWSIILMAQMTNQNKAELIDYFHLVWTKNPQF